MARDQEHDLAAVAERFGQTERTVRRWIQRGELEASHLARGVWIIRESAIQRYIDLKSNTPATRRRARRRLPRGGVRPPGNRGTLIVTAEMGRR